MQQLTFDRARHVPSEDTRSILLRLSRQARFAEETFTPSARSPPVDQIISAKQHLRHRAGRQLLAHCCNRK
jgi:hypothetical protein